RARVLVGGDDALNATVRQDRREHAGAGADVKGQVIRRQRRFAHQLEVFAAHRGEHTVVRMDSVAGRRAERRYLDTFLAPLVRADQAQQFAQRRHRRLAVGGPPRLQASLTQVRPARKRNAVVAFQCDQQPAQRARSLALRLAVQVEGFGGRCGHRSRFARFAVGAAGHRLQQLPRVLKVAAPQQRRAFAGEPVSGVGGERVVHDLDTLGCRHTRFRAPTRGARLAAFRPLQLRRVAHKGLPPAALRRATRWTNATAPSTTAPATTPTTALSSIGNAPNAAPAPSVKCSSALRTGAAPCTSIPPPTRNIAAVPATERPFISQGAARRMAAPADRAAEWVWPLRYRPRSSSLTMTATSPYTPAVITTAIAPSTASWTANALSATVPSVMAMISAERMKSVRTAPLILSFSTTRRSIFGLSSARCSSSWWASS